MSKRLFIAIKINPTEELLGRVSLFQENLKEENINWIKPDHFHLTLKFLGKTSLNKIEGMVKVLEKCIKKELAFNLSLSEHGVFGSKYSPRVIWVGVEPEQKLINLSRSISFEMEGFGFELDRQNFVPHLTIARIRKLKNKAHFQQVFERLGSRIQFQQEISEVILFESKLQSKGAEYIELAKIPLG